MKSRTGIYIIILSACATLTALGYYFYKKYATFTPTVKSADYTVKIDFQP
jgi:hypothetical protein